MAPPAARPGSTATTLATYQALDWQAAFGAIARDVRYEPYPGLQRGADGTAQAAQGNSLDQAVLLAHAIEDEVAAYRFVQGRLDAEAAAQLTATLFPDNVQVRPTAQPYDPAADAQLQGWIQQHTWLEVKPAASDDWVALDPSFHQAVVDQAFAAVSSRFDSPPRRLMQTLRVTLKAQAYSGPPRSLGSVNAMVSELAGQPFTVRLQGVPAYDAPEGAAEPEAQTPSVGNPFGALGGGRPKPTPQPDDAAEEAPVTYGPPIGTDVTGTLTVGGQSRPIPALAMRLDDPDGFLKRIWIEFDLLVPGQPIERFERALYESTAETATRGPMGLHRYNVVVVNGPMTQAAFEAHQATTVAEADPDAWRTTLAQVEDPEATAETLNAALAAEEAAGPAMGHLLGLAFAAESDRISQGIARRGGVTMTYPTPRVLMTSVEVRPGADQQITTEVNLDLRRDEVAAWPYPGMPEGAATLFQVARGVQESALEGAVLAKAMGEDVEVVTTARVMEAADAQRIPVHLIHPEQRRGLDATEGLSTWDRQRITQALDAGDQIILPAQPVDIAGVPRRGWWQVDGTTGAFIGVMEGGEHQSMIQYQTLNERQILDPAQGFMLGMLNGAVGTQVLLAAGMLKYGQYTEALKEEVRARLEYLTCLMCPEAKLEISLGSTGGVSVETACYEFEIIKSHELSWSKDAQLPWCPYYKKGLSCAASLLLDGLQVDVVVDPGGGPSIDWTVPYDCGG